MKMTSPMDKMGYKTIDNYKGVEIRSEPGLSHRIYAYYGDELIQVYDDKISLKNICNHLDELLKQHKK